MADLKVSLCITVFNEEKTITKLLESILSQTKVPDEIIIVDGGSFDATASIIQKFRAEHRKILLIISKGASIAKGRNLAIKNAKYPLIAMTDAGCILKKDWLHTITFRLCSGQADVVAGFYEMCGGSYFQKALKPYLGIMPDKFDEKNFLPSTRSIAFKKSVWEKIGGFDEKFDKAGEDTQFNFEILRRNFKIVRTKNAIVDWEVPNSLLGASRKFYYYSRGDAQSGNLLSRHNLHTLTIFGRYILFLLFLPLFFIYLIYAYWKAGPWGTIIQVASDFSIMAGFLDGLFKTNNKRFFLGGNA